MLNFEEIMHTQLIVVFVSGFLALLGIRILISSFDDDDNDGDGMAYSTRDSYQFRLYCLGITLYIANFERRASRTLPYLCIPYQSTELKLIS